MGNFPFVHTYGRKISPFYRTLSPIGAAAQKGRQDQYEKKNWGDKTRDEKQMERQDARQKKWGYQTETKKMGRRDARQKKNGETRHETKTNGETRRRTKKWGDEMQDGKKWGDKTQDKKK